MLHRFQILARVAIVATLSVMAISALLFGCASQKAAWLEVTPSQAISASSTEALIERAAWAATNPDSFDDSAMKAAGWSSRREYRSALIVEASRRKSLPVDTNTINSIVAGNIWVGMSPDQTLMSKGYPHNTGQFKSEYTDVVYWHYRGANYQTTTLSFENNSLTSIIR